MGMGTSDSDRINPSLLKASLESSISERPPPQKKQHFPDKQEVSSKFCKISCWWNFMEHQSLRWVIQFYFITKNLLKNHLLDKQEVGSKFKTWAKQCDSDNINPSLLKLPLKAAFQNDPPPKKKTFALHPQFIFNWRRPLLVCGNWLLPLFHRRTKDLLSEWHMQIVAK